VKAFLFIFSLFLMAFYNTMLSDTISIYGVSIDLPVALVTLTAFSFNEFGTTWFAILLAIVASTQRLDFMPWEIGSLAGIAIAVNMISVRMNLDSTASKLVLMGCSVLAHNILITAVFSFENFYFVLLRYILPGVAYSLILGWVFIVVGKGLLGLGRMRM